MTVSLRSGQSGLSVLRLATVESGGERRKLSKELKVRRAEMAVRVRRMWMFVIKTNVEVSLKMSFF